MSSIYVIVHTTIISMFFFNIACVAFIPHAVPIDPLIVLETQLYDHMFGNKTTSRLHNLKNLKFPEDLHKYPSGKHLRKEYFKGKKAVHASFPDILILPGLNLLNVTNDYMQTAVDAFSIMFQGSMFDVINLPPQYMLNSAHTLAMMRVAREKLAAIWDIVKGKRHASTISITVLQQFRPLFKYLNGKEMASLNLTDERILAFIGTHEELSRHQVGVVASAYIKLNPLWNLPYYLNTMNNVICGLPISFLRRIPTKSYLQLNFHVLYHIYSCDELQKKHLLTVLSQTQTLGKPFSWSEQEIAKLGLIMTAVDGPDLASINPNSFVGLTAQVLSKMDPVNLQYLNQKQINKLSKKAYNVLAKKMQKFRVQHVMSNNTSKCINLIRMFIAVAWIVAL